MVVKTRWVPIMHKLTFKSKDEAPEALRDFLAENADKAFEVTLVPQKKLNEFRDNNIKVSKDKDALEATLKPFKALALKEDGTEVPLEDLLKDIGEWRKTAQLVQDGKLKGDDAISKEIDQRVSNMKTAHQEQLRSLEVARDGWKTKFETQVSQNNQMRIDTAISQIAARADIGVNMEALPDILRRARDEFVIEEGKLVVKKDGAVVRGEDGVSPLSPEEWVKSLRKSAGYYFKGSNGGGAGGGDGGTTEVGLSPEALAKMSPEARLALANEKLTPVRRTAR